MKIFIVRRLYMYLLVLTLICCSTPIKSVYAVTPNDNLGTLENESISLQDQAKLLLLLEATAATQTQSIQESIDVLKSAIDQDNLVIEQHKKAIADLDSEQQRLADEQKRYISNLGNYVKNLYTDGDTPFLTYVSWLVSSTSFDDLINRYSYVDTIHRNYQDLKAKIAANSDLLKSKRSLELAETNKLTDEVKAKQQLLDGLNVALAKQNEVLKFTTNDSLLNMQTQSRGQQTESERLMAAEQLQAQLATQANYQQLLASQLLSDKSQGTLNTLVKFNGQVSQILSFASTFLGVPYTWGGTFPQFDCSSYVQYVYGHFGIKLNRVTWDQYNEGQDVSKDKLQAGDLVFFSTYQAGPSHVGIYIGNGIMINCSNSGVSYANINSEYWSTRYYGARRVIAQ
ncbi:MAG: NlpC/P60 family protein [Bacillota bacterium]|nr:NlpC/P60 family protein [Bacillota bacterium]MDP4158325.1 NlpC/P60 family protein [Bacillota bacterium]